MAVRIRLVADRWASLCVSSPLHRRLASSCGIWWGPSDRSCTNSDPYTGGRGDPEPADIRGRIGVKRGGGHARVSERCFALSMYCTGTGFSSFSAVRVYTPYGFFLCTGREPMTRRPDEVTSPCAGRGSGSNGRFHIAHACTDVRLGKRGLSES